MAKEKADQVQGAGTPGQPWALTTPSGSSEFTAYRDESANPPALVVKVGKTELRYHLRALEDLHAMLQKHGDWMLLGECRRAETGRGGHGGGVGAVGQEPRGRLVRLKKDFAAVLRYVRRP